MKNIITTFTVFIFNIVFLFGQNLDSIQFSYINQYRIKNGKKPLIWVDTLVKESVKQVDKMIERDSSFHSHNGNGWYAENCSYNKNSGFLTPKNGVSTSYTIKNGVKINEEKRIDVGVESFSIFVKKYFNLSYQQVMEDPNIYFITNTIFMWAADEYHKKILLSNTKYGSTRIVIKNVVKSENTIFGKELYSGIGPYYYRALVSSTFNTY